jgi:thioredoxin-like negative regulator of GroEL
VAETPAIVEAVLEATPAIPAWRALLALMLLESGRREEARAIFDELAADEFADVSRDFTWPASLCLLSSVCAGLGDAERAEVLLGLYQPHAGHLAVIGWGNVCAGAVDRFLGMLQATLQRWDEAERALRAALELEARVQSRPSLVRTRVAYADVLRRRGDETRARELLAQAAADADALGMHGVVVLPG